MERHFVLIAVLIFDVVCFQSCYTAEQSNDSRKVVKPRVMIRIQSDISKKELNLLSEKGRDRLGSSHIYLDDFHEMEHEVEVAQEVLSSYIHVDAATKNPIIVKKT